MDQDKRVGSTTNIVRLGIDHNNQHALVVLGSGPNMLGRDWFSMLKLNRAAVNKVDRDDFLEPYQAVFSEGLGTL